MSMMSMISNQIDELRELANKYADDAFKIYGAIDTIEALSAKMGAQNPISQNQTEPNNSCEVDIISRRDALKTIRSYKHRLQGKGQTYFMLLEEFKSLPSAEITDTEECQKCQESVDRVLTKTMKWLEKHPASAPGMTFYECENCGQKVSRKTPFCASCGSSMRGDEE